MGPIRAILRCYFRMFDFFGRARRAEFWWFALYQFLLGTGLSIALQIWLAKQLSNGEAVDFQSALPLDEQALAAYIQSHPEIWNYAGYAFAAYLVGLILPNLAVTIRRLHDTNRSGWFILMPTGVSIICIFVGMMVMASGSAAGAILGLVIMGVVPMIAYIWLLVVLALPGSHGNNRFGPDSIPNRKPKRPDHPAFAQELEGEAKLEMQAENKAVAQDYYRTHVLPSIQKGPVES